MTPAWSVLRRLAPWCALLLACSPLAAQTDRRLSQRLTAILDQPPYDRVLWGVAVHDDRGRLLFGRNEQRLFIPASNTKLVVSAVATALLPPDWTVRTSVYGTGPITNGVLEGDLILYGRGDPSASRRCYATDTTLAGVCEPDPLAPYRRLADTLKARGIRVVAGDLVGDGSYFEPELVHPSWESYDLNWWYAAPVSGLAVNDNSVDIFYAPGSTPGAPVSLSLFPDLGIISLDNRSWTSDAPGGPTLDFFRDEGTLRIRAVGSLPLSARGTTEYFALPDPNYYAASVLRRLLGEQGIAVLGATRSTTDSMDYAAVRGTPALAEAESRPLKDWIFAILNSSQNLFAEMLFKHLGRTFGAAGSWDEGRTVARRFLIDSVGVDSTAFRLSDGSGLSSNNLISPVAFARLLGYMRQHRNFASFENGLPRPGVPGSLRTRMVNTPVQSRVKAKTGTTALASTLSGYLDREGGRYLTFVIQGNHHALSDRLMRPQIDSLVVELGRRYR